MSVPIKNIDALSGLANNPDLSAKLLHTHLYDGTLTIPALADLSKSGPVFYYAQWSGDDSRGFDSSADINAAFDTTSSYCRTEVIITNTPPKSPDTGAGDVVADTAADLAEVYTVSYAPNDMPGGIGNKIILQQLKRSCNEWGVSTPQIWSHIIGRNDWATKQIPALLYSFQVRIPTNIADIMDRRGSSLPEWCEELFLKTHDDNAHTDSRIAVKLYRDGVTRALKFEALCDLFVKDLAGTDKSFMTLWSLKSADDTLIGGDAYRIDLYFKPPSGISDVSGELQILITNLSKNVVAMADSITDITMCGFYSYNFARVAFAPIYTGGFPPSGNITFEYGNFKIERRPGGLLPFLTPKTIHDFVWFHAPLTSSLTLSSGSGTATVTGFTPSYNDDGLLMSPGNVLTYPASGNYSNQTGTWLICVTKDDWSTGNGVAFGKTGVGIMLSASNSGVYASDGSDTVVGPAGVPHGTMVIGVRFSGTKFQCFSNGQFGTANNSAFTAGTFVFTNFEVMKNSSGRVRNAMIYTRWLSDAEIQKITADLLGG